MFPSINSEPLDSQLKLKEPRYIDQAKKRILGRTTRSFKAENI